MGTFADENRRSRVPKSVVLVYLAFVICLGVVTYAQPLDGACPTCGREPRFPDETRFLSSFGYSASQYEVLMSWSEVARDGSGRFVTGYRLRPLAGGNPFDLYSDGESSLLSKEQLVTLGIPTKRWDLPPVEKFGETPSLPARSLIPTPVPEGVRKSIEPAGGVIVPEVDLMAVLAEDAQREAEQGKGATRIGVIQDLDESIVVYGDAASHGIWQAVPGGGRLWSVAVLSPDALGLRIHFASIELPLGARVVVYNPENSSEAYGPYFGPSSGREDLWSATCFSESAVIECFVPAASDLSAVNIEIDQVVHNYVTFGDLPWAKVARGAGACNLDVTCYSNWQTTSYGVGGVGSVGGNGSFFCTGSLLADSDPNTNIPYFLTANHCVGTQSQASSVEIYWLYQTSTCNGTPPSPASVPRTTGGAQLLATTTANSGTDFCLLRLNNNAANGVSYLGWSSSEAPIGTPTVCIHHPSADFKRITFGDVTNVPESSLSSRPRDRYHQSSWRPNLGVTEPGSSGSPLFNEITQQVIGQLWGGPSSCSPSSTKLDYYGRFDVSYPLISDYLGMPSTGTIQVTNPVAGRKWRQGTVRRVKWVSIGEVGNKVRIELWKGGSFDSVIKGNTANDGKAKWAIPLTQPVGSDYTIKISSVSNPSIFDVSDPFSIRAP